MLISNFYVYEVLLLFQLAINVLMTQDFVIDFSQNVKELVPIFSTLKVKSKDQKITLTKTSRRKRERKK